MWESQVKEVEWRKATLVILKEPCRATLWSGMGELSAGARPNRARTGGQGQHRSRERLQKEPNGIYGVEEKDWACLGYYGRQKPGQGVEYMLVTGLSLLV